MNHMPGMKTYIKHIRKSERKKNFSIMTTISNQTIEITKLVKVLLQETTAANHYLVTIADPNQIKVKQQIAIIKHVEATPQL